MPEIHNFAEANAVLARAVPTNRNRNYKLNLMRQLMAFLGNPQNQLRIIHVAGTSGKTSTSYYVAALLQAAGKSVGLTVSPHVAAVNERVQFNLVPMPETDFCAELNKFFETIEPSGLKPSYFEILVAFAFWQFAKRQVDYAVVEVGLGGLLDGTNVIDREDKVCVITDIGFDHVDVLGHTLAAISGQKAGIIQEHNVVFCHQQSSEVIDVIRERCQQQQAELHIIDELPASELTFLPSFQQRNFSLAEQAVEFIAKRDQFPALTSKKMLDAAHVLVPARMEIFETTGKTVILDGSHNGQKLEALVAGVKQQFPDQAVTSLISFAAGDEYRLPEALKQIANLSQHIIITSFSSEQDLPKRSVEPDDIIALLARQKFTAVETVTDPRQALTELLKRAEPILLVTGSFYLLNHIRPLMLKT